LDDMRRVAIAASLFVAAVALGLLVLANALTGAAGEPALASADTMPAVVSIFGRRLPVQRGKTQVMLGCPSSETSCAITLTLRGPRRRVLAAREVSVAGDSKAVIQMRLRTGVEAQVRQAGLLPGTLTARVVDAAGNLSKRFWDVRLKIAKSPHAIE
jgi:hypothetical protein